MEVPFFFAVTFPFFVTESTFLLATLHVAFFLVPLTLSFTVSPTESCTFVLFNLTVAATWQRFLKAVNWMKKWVLQKLQHPTHMDILTLVSFHVNLASDIIDVQ